jgi:hypothetical protein
LLLSLLIIRPICSLTSGVRNICEFLKTKKRKEIKN